MHGSLYAKACLKIHSRRLHTPLCVIFAPSDNESVKRYFDASDTLIVPCLLTPAILKRSICINSGYSAHYAPFIWHKSPTICNAHTAKNNFQTRSSTQQYNRATSPSGTSPDHPLRCQKTAGRDKNIFQWKQSGAFFMEVKSTVYEDLGMRALPNALVAVDS